MGIAMLISINERRWVKSFYEGCIVEMRLNGYANACCCRLWTLAKVELHEEELKADQDLEVAWYKPWSHCLNFGNCGKMGLCVASVLPLNNSFAR